ncbi:MAG: AHH domain-containing protein [Paracoccus sp. (in: a-proteobacteria)]|nr:AHH domain-containing protein [Paracoccus sp. (in: a-proteobacteria)]
MEKTRKTRNLTRLGYQLNVVENLALVPDNGFLACHLKCPMHRGNREWGSYSYHEIVRREISDITNDLQHYCRQRPPTNDIQPDMDRKSMLMAAMINQYRAPLTQVATDFRPQSRIGCSNTETVNHSGQECSDHRDHHRCFSVSSLATPYMILPGR